MYKVEKVVIEGFWGRVNIACNFKNDVNIVIGRNGTGKTTFMNILGAILTVDVDGLSNNEFKSAKVVLVDNGRRKTIKVEKSTEMVYPYPVVEYQISRKVRRFHIIGSDDRKTPSFVRKKILEDAKEVRQELHAMVSVSSLSVYRLRSDDEYEIRDRAGSRVVSPVDFRLGQAMKVLTQFQLELAQKTQQVSQQLQKDVLASILYGKEDDGQWGVKLNFDKKEEEERLVSAYRQLNAIDAGVQKKISFHVGAIDKVIAQIRSPRDGGKKEIDFKPLEALRKTRNIIALSLAASEETRVIYSQLNMFLEILTDFIVDKKFEFSSGNLVVYNRRGAIDHDKLSSGEKQLLILMVEALLQKQEPNVFLADEPELSLHIAWQRKIIPAIKKLNPNAQVIVATHSPEVASKYRESIFDMESLFDGRI